MPLASEMLGTSRKGGVALRREWVADQAEVFCSANGADAVLVGPCTPEDLMGFLLAAVRLDLPAVVVRDDFSPFDVVPYALGFAPVEGDPVEVAVEKARSGESGARRVVDNFSLANALRAGLSAGAGPELLVHLAAVAREAGVAGFPRMIRVLAPESPAVADSAWLREHGPAGLIAGLGNALHDTPTVAGRLKEALPPSAPLSGVADGRRLYFLRGRASRTEVVCQASASTEEVSGECRVFASEAEAVRAVEGSEIGEGNLLVVMGLGARGGPGLLPLDGLGTALAEAGLGVPVLTDGLPPSKVSASTWISLWTPEAASGGVIGLLRDGDTLRFDLAEGRIRTGVSADGLASREPFTVPVRPRFGYAARYARAALAALEGAGFG